MTRVGPAAIRIEDGYVDTAGRWHATDPDVAALIRAALATPSPAGGAGLVPPWIVDAGQTVALPEDVHAATIHLEDSSVLRCERQLPPDLPLGYHSLIPLDEQPARALIVTPPRAHSAPPRSWAWTVQVPSLRAAGDWGIGDLGDVARFGSAATRLGATHVLLSPLHATGCLLPQQDSPYSASSRRWRNPLLIDIDQVRRSLPETDDEPTLDALARRARGLNEANRIDRNLAWAVKREALGLLWEVQRRAPAPAFEAWRATQGTSLTVFATHEALAETYQRPWPQWPSASRHPDSPTVGRFARDHATLVAFHAWLQWLIEQQLAHAATTTTLLCDLAVGSTPDGADAWALQDCMALGARIGAPPDDFNVDGQNWGVIPFHPTALQQAGYRPFIEMLRGAFNNAGGVRIDHVMGLFRLYLVPDGRPNHQGAYVSYPARDLLALLSLESVRAGAFVIGEDLGTVGASVRSALAERGVLSTRLVLFEKDPPDAYPEHCFAAVTTHDLPTITGLFDGTDAEDRRAAGADDDPAADALLKGRVLAAAASVDGDVPAMAEARVEAVVPDDLEILKGVHRALAASPARIAAATIEDALGLRHRPNLPGTVGTHPNWVQRVPLSVEQFASQPGVRAIADAFASRAGGRRERPHGGDGGSAG